VVFIPFYHLLLEQIGEEQGPLTMGFILQVYLQPGGVQLAPALGVNLHLALNNSQHANLQNETIQTNIFGRATATVLLDKGEKSSGQLIAEIVGCVNSDKSTCSITVPSFYRDLSGEGGWEWWQYLLTIGGAVIGFLLVVGIIVGAWVYILNRRSRAKADGYMSINMTP